MLSVQAAALFVGLTASVSTVAYAGPNDVCADQEGFAAAQSMVKEHTAFVKAMKSNFLDKMVLAGVVPLNYAIDDFANDLSSKGTSQLAKDWAQRGILSDSAKGISSRAEDYEEVIKTALVDNHFAEYGIAYLNYLTISHDPVATRYDRDLDKVSCTFTYSLNFTELRKIAIELHDQRSAELYDQSTRITTALGSKLTATYTVQPDGKGGSTLMLLPPQ